MSKIIFINRYFYPDESATSQILTDLAFHLAEKGYDINVITSRLTYGDPSKKHPKYEIHKGVEIIRIKTSSFGRSNIIGRILDYVSFYFLIIFAVLKKASKGDIVIAKTDPPLLGVLVGYLANFKKSHCMNWLQDIYPDIAEKVDTPLIKPWLATPLRRLRNRSLKKARHNIVIGAAMQQFLISQGVNKTKISLIPNWCNDEVIVPVNLKQNPLRKDWGFKPTDFVIAYSGNLGWAHDFNTILDAASLLRDKPNIFFLFISGSKFHNLLKEIKVQRKLDNIIHKPYQPREKLHLSLGVANVHWFSLKPEIEGTLLPSKFYGIAAAGKAALFVGNKNGEIGEMIKTAKCGLSFDIGEGQALADSILSLSQSPDRCAQYGQNARVLLEKKYTKGLSLQKWETLLQNCRD